MRIAAVADIHVANHRRMGGPVVASINRRGRQVIDALATAANTAAADRCEALWVLGDLHDTVRPEPQLVAAVQRVLREANLDVYLLVGNHDQVSTQKDDHVLNPYDGNNITIVDEPDIFSCGVVAVPFRPGNARDWLPAAVASLMAKHRDLRPGVLVTHVGVIDDKTPAFLRDAHDAVPVTLLMELAERWRFHTVLTGNWHYRREWHGNGQPGGLPVVLQVGTLAPTGFDNPGLDGYGTLAEVDAAASGAGSLRWRVVPGPRFVRGTEAEIGQLISMHEREPKAAQHKLYVQVIADPENMERATADLAEAVAAGLVCDGEPVPDGALAEAAARTAATTARSAQTLDDALAAYVGQMPLAEDVDRAVVLAESKRYLAATPK